MLCPTCGKDLKKGSRFCAYCGTTLAEEDLLEYADEEVPPVVPPETSKPEAPEYAPSPAPTGVAAAPSATTPLPPLLPLESPGPPPPPLRLGGTASTAASLAPFGGFPAPAADRRHRPRVIAGIIAILLLLVGGTVVLALLLTGTAKVAVPDLVGRSIEEVRQALQQSGLGIEEAESSQSRYANGQVLSQNPAAGSSVVKGSVVRVVVNKRTNDDSGHNTGDTKGDENGQQQESVDISSAATITASSTLASDAPGVDYGAGNLTDNNNATCWAEGSSGYGMNDWVKFTFPVEYQVTRLSVIPGLLKMDGDKDRWLQNGRLKTVKVVFDDGTTVSHTFQDQKNYQDILFATPVKAKTITVVIVEAYPGQSGATWTAAQDTSVSEMHVFGYMPGV